MNLLFVRLTLSLVVFTLVESVLFLRFFSPSKEKKKKFREGLPSPMDEGEQDDDSNANEKEKGITSPRTSIQIFRRNVKSFLYEMDTGNAFFGTEYAGQISTYWASEIEALDRAARSVSKKELNSVRIAFKRAFDASKKWESNVYSKFLSSTSRTDDASSMKKIRKLKLKKFIPLLYAISSLQLVRERQSELLLSDMKTSGSALNLVKKLLSDAENEVTDWFPWLQLFVDQNGFHVNGFAFTMLILRAIAPEKIVAEKEVRVDDLFKEIAKNTIAFHNGKDENDKDKGITIGAARNIVCRFRATPLSVVYENIETIIKWLAGDAQQTIPSNLGQSTTNIPPPNGEGVEMKDKEMTCSPSGWWNKNCPTAPGKGDASGLYPCLSFNIDTAEVRIAEWAVNKVT